IITSDNENGISDDIRYTSYLLTTEGLQQVDSAQEYYIFGGWYNTPDDLRISPDCTKLATTYKGHYLVLCRFDNANGDLYDLMPSYVDMQTSFVAADLDKVEFSPNSNYLYALGDQHLIKQYSLEFWNESSIANSVTTIYDSGWGSGEIWTDMKLGPDDKIYLHDIESDELDVIANPDAPGTEVEITQGIITGLDLDSFFPNTAGYQCSVAASVTVEHIYECLGDSTEFYYSITSPADSVTWNFGDPDTGLDNFSTLDSPIHVFSDVGTYYITFNYFLYGEWNSMTHQVTIYTIPEVDLPEIIEACEGDEVVIDAGESPYSYTWTTGDTTQSIIVTLPGIYTVSVSNGSCFAGDFTQVSFLGPVELDLEFNYTLCEGDSLVLDLSDSGAETIEWSNGETDPVIVITESGNFNVYAENACASSSQNFGVDVIDLPSSLLPGSIVQCVSEPVVLSVDYPGADVAWSTGETGQQITVEESGTYAVSVEVGNCTAEDEIVVTLYEYIPLDDIAVPNIFTPNGDGENELFRPFLKSDPEFDLCGFSGIQVDMQVYDRWGNLHASHVCSWDGKSDGGQWLSDEVYYYIIDLHSSCNSEDEHKQGDGWVHLTGK
ncbi:MAG: gliding motility-associated C-terminal domain-containing protein, partial [Flavobacteriales bacterium]|nr:gliding motility-associated C-terminal domain-containing protein [Flavobacteriales bacterium]